MPISIVYMFILVGLALIVIALLGGGIEVKEIKIPALQIIPRIFSFFTGCAILALCFLRTDIFQVLNDNKFPSAPPIVNPSPREFEPEPSAASPPTLAQPSTPVQPSTPPAHSPIPVQPPAPAQSSTLEQPRTPAQPSSPPKPQGLPRSQTSWYVVLGSFDANNGDFAVSSAKRVKNKASEECHVPARTELTAKIEGFTPGYVSTLLGPYETHEDAVADKEKVLPCVPDAYIRSVARQ